jgi:hypothetical protein
MTPNARFTEFITDINPSPTTNSRSKAAHTAIRNAIWADAAYKTNLIGDFLGGSYFRQTAIRPVTKNGDTERPDVDIYVVVKGSTWLSTPEDLINDLYYALDRARTGLGITALSRNRCSIAISTNNADMDISPLLDRQDDGFYRIGNRTTGEWYKTDPEFHSSWSTRQNDHFSGRLKPTVKMVKWTRRENPTRHRHPKSFSLEVIMAAHMSATQTHYGQILHDAFDGLLAHHSFSREMGLCPVIDDPAIPDGNLLAGVSGEAFAAFYDKIASHRDDAARALSAANQDTATMYWRRIFGVRFPATTRANASNALQQAAVMSPLSFPATAAQPSRRPAKFA